MKYVISGLEKIRDVIDADSPEQAEMLFKSKYPSCYEVTSKMILDEFNKKKTASIKLSKSQWEFIGKKAGWMKKAQVTSKWFEWEDEDGTVWAVTYRDLDDNDMYSNGIAISNVDLIKKMVVEIQNMSTLERIPIDLIPQWMGRVKMDESDFFDEIKSADKIFEAEREEERRDMEMGL